ncbi:MAG: ABC transporter ATP-binding protein [Pseudomonadota bacterium]
MTAPATPDTASKSVGPIRRQFAPWNDETAVPFIQFQSIIKRFGEFTAVNNVSLNVFQKEFFSLLGPSGCGKTTLLRMLAGFETPTEGRIMLDGQDVSRVPPHRRPVNMMFQSYALFPHMTVEKNIAFGLEQDKLPKGEIADRVAEMLRLVKLEPFAKRKPQQLSGGQRQRVALARSIAKRPKVLLLDEPLGALDKKLRESTQFELMDIQEKLGLTFMIVTHDQEEAMTVSDRIAVMDHGELIQVAPPSEIYEYPNSRYVADFIGDINLIEAKVTGTADPFALENADFGSMSAERPRFGSLDVGEVGHVAVRPEKVRIGFERPADAANAAEGEVWDIGYFGDVSTYHVKLASGQIVKALQANATRLIERPITWEDRVWVSFSPDGAVVLAK